jgi:hypothetical protein
MVVFFIAQQKYPLQKNFICFFVVIPVCAFNLEPDLIAFRILTGQANRKLCQVVA